MQATRALAALVALSALAAGDQLVLHPTKDNTLYEDPNGALSNGAGDSIFAGRSGPTGGGLIRRALLAFDVSAIPAGSTITSVLLELECTQSASPAQVNVAIRRVLADWGEGGSIGGLGGGGGAPSQPGDATWIHTFFPGTTWAASGGDFAAAVSGSLPVTSPGHYGILSVGLRADVQSWVDNPGTSFGWVLIGDESAASTAKKFASREDVAFAPKLTVGFLPAEVYCTPKTNSLGCVPALTATGASSASAASGFVVGVSNVLNRKPGFFVYGQTGRAAAPFHGGFLCVNGPLFRTPTVSSNGNPPPSDCTGSYAVDFNAFAAGGIGGAPKPFLRIPGTVVDCQSWSRDQGFARPDNFALSAGLEFVVGP